MREHTGTTKTASTDPRLPQQCVASRNLATMRAVVLCRQRRCLEIFGAEAREVRIGPPAERLRDQSWPVSCIARQSAQAISRASRWSGIMGPSQWQLPRRILHKKRPFGTARGPLRAARGPSGARGGASARPIRSGPPAGTLSYRASAGCRSSIVLGGITRCRLSHCQRQHRTHSRVQAGGFQDGGGSQPVRGPRKRGATRHAQPRRPQARRRRRSTHRGD